MSIIMSSSMYSVNAFLNGAFIFQSDFFATKSDAIYFMNSLKSSDTGDIQFQLYKSYPRGSRMYGNGSQSMTNTHVKFENNDENFSTMTFEKYGRGYLLRPASGDMREGTKYFYDGFWMPKHYAWFFKSSMYQFLINMGAEYISDTTHETTQYTHETQTDSSDIFTDMTVTDYKHGLLLKAPEDNQYYGMKYFEDGYWNDTLIGWIFRRSQLDSLVNRGAVYISEVEIEDDDDEEYSDGEFHNMTVSKYGRGYLLHPNGDERAGEKYFFDGFWMPSRNAWFYKSTHKQMLLDCGATMA